MYRPNPLRNLAFAAFAALTLLALPAVAAPIASVNVGAANIDWHANVAYDELVLTVSGPGEVDIRQAFKAGEAPSFSVFDQYGKALPDGTYVWELSLVPALDEGTRAALDEARLIGDSNIVTELRAAGKLPVDTVQSGVFSLAGGVMIADLAASEPTKVAPGGDGDLPSTKDNVILDDLIVDGSACVGLDCVNGESFGFDTLRLKENNLRIKFQDTSSSASFPGNDWQITANDSGNGGANKFSIDDIDAGRTPFTIEAGAQANTLYVEGDGDVGIKTANPVVDLHIVEGNTPTLRLEQDGSDGFTPQTYDVAANESNFFIRDVTNGSKLFFRSKPNAPEDSIFIDADGDIGLGTDGPDADLHIRDTGTASANDNADFDIEANGQIWRLRVNRSTGQFNWINNSSGNNEVPLRITNTATNNLLQLGVNAANRVDITGSLFINGTDNSTPDYVFEDDYALESIKEHADFMWTNKHLPAVHPAQVDENGKTFFSMGDRAQGVLEELEKAHIYIDQLHSTIEDLVSRVEQLEAGE